ncbi:MAG: type II toxin-antitoxin system RelE/ParE family toxin [Patescibacteria group bacterium]
MDKIAKFLKRLDAKERAQVRSALSSLLSGDTGTLDIKKLKGVDDVYRIRAGSLRIIFTKKNGDVRVLAIDRRDDTTYRGF